MHTISFDAECLEKTLRPPRNASLKEYAWRRLAEGWVNRSIAVGCNPQMRQAPASSEGFAGEWLLTASLAGIEARLSNMPNKLFDEVFQILGGLNRIRHDPDFKPWHGNVLLDNGSPFALAFRLRLARQGLNMEQRQFYRCCGFNQRAGEALESANPVFARANSEILQAVCERHDIPEEWMTYGSAAELELE
jgi:hypothetical protein